MDSMASTDDTKEKTTIFSLPAELRNQIWYFALEDNSKQCTRKRRARPCRWCVGRCLPYKEPALLSVSRQVRSETQGIWYGNTTFYFHDGVDKLLEFLVFLGNHKTAKIACLKDEPSFGKPEFAHQFLDEVYHKIRSLGIHLPESAIEVTAHEGLRLLRTTRAKETRVAMRRNSKGEIAISGITTLTSVNRNIAESLSNEDEQDSDATLLNSDGESDTAYYESNESETSG